MPAGKMSSGIPQRIISLDYCADQYLLKMVHRDNIRALSPDAPKAFSYMRESAKGIPKVRPQAEDILRLKPDLVIRSYGGGPNANAFFKQAGIPVLNIGWANDIESIKRVTIEVANALGAPKKGRAIVKDIEKRLSQLPNIKEKKQALYMTPSGVTSGSGSLVHEMFLEAGLDNFQETPGWQSLPLEQLAYTKPDVIAAAFFDTKSQNKDNWSTMRHPIAKSHLKFVPTINLDGSWTSCGAWYLVDAIEALANGAKP